MSRTTLMLLIVGLLGINVEGFRIWYTIVNYITWDEQVFFATRPVWTTAKPFIEIMRDVAEINDQYNFTGIDFGDPLGIYINSINGVYEDVPNQIAWAFLRKEKRSPFKFCSLPVGVSTYVPSDMDEIYFVLERWSIHSDLPTCDGGPPHDGAK